jgi:dolichol-phosphate mannosyltransferase
MLSIVVSVYNEAEVLDTFHENIHHVLQLNDLEYELIFVNDGSSDSSQAILDRLAGRNKNIRLLQFSRNFGHEAAMIAGIDYAVGEAIICMDADMQHPPLKIPEIYNRYKNGDVDIINMVRIEKEKNIKSKLFYFFINKISPLRLEPNASDFFLISARVAKILRNDYRERVRFLRGFIQIIGFNKATIQFELEARKAGESKYPIRKLLSLSVTAVATLSKLPLKAGIYIGFISALFSIALVMYSIFMKFIDQPVPGYTTIVVFMGIMFSMQFFILGIIGEYIGFLFDEQKGRPLYIVDKLTNFDDV